MPWRVYARRIVDTIYTVAGEKTLARTAVSRSRAERKT
jgi:hypothetical protein